MTYAVAIPITKSFTNLSHLVRALELNLFGGYYSNILIFFLFFRIIKQNKVSITFMRKFFCLFSHVVPGLLLIALGYTGCAPILSIALISFSMGSNGAATLTNLVNHQDLAPNYAATLYGIANGIGNTAGFVTPLVTAYFTKNGVSLFVNAYGTGDNPKFRRFSNFILILCMFCAKLRTFFLST